MLIFLVAAGLIAWYFLPRIFYWIADRKQFDLSGAFGLAGLGLAAAFVSAGQQRN